MKNKHLILVAAFGAAILVSGCSQKEQGQGGGGKINHIALKESSIDLSKGQTYTLTPAFLPVNPDNAELVWSSSDEDVATVSGGVVTAKADGTAEISVRPMTAIYDMNFSIVATCKVFVETIMVREIKFGTDTYNISLTAGSFQLEPEIVPQAANREGMLVYQVISGENVLSVSPSGLVTMKSTGQAKIRVSAKEGDASAELTFNVQEADVWPTSISFDLMEDMVAGGKQRVRIVYEPATANRKVLLADGVTTGNINFLKATKISDEEIELEALKPTDGTINENSGIQLIVSFQSGFVPGTENPKYQTGPEKYVFIHAQAPSISVDMDQAAAWGKLSDGMVVGETHDLQVSVENMHSKILDYEVSTPNVLSVDESGKITALEKGLSSIAVRTKDGKSSQTIRVEVFDQPKTVTPDKTELWIRYHSFQTVSFVVKDARGKQSRPTISLNGTSLPASVQAILTDSGVSGKASVNCRSTRSSASTTQKGSLTVSAAGYPSVKTTLNVYDTMYDADDIKVFDGIQITPGGSLIFIDGGYRGSGYFEEVSDAVRSKFEASDCKALVVWTGKRSSLNLTESRLSLGGKKKVSDRESVNGLAISKNNAYTALPGSSDANAYWQKAKTSVNGTQYYVGASLWGGGTPIPTYVNRQYGYELTTAMKNYNANRSSDYTILPVKYLSNYTEIPSSSGTSGWYLPTSSEWYMMLSCLGAGSTTKAAAIKISEYLVNWMEGDPILDLTTESSKWYFWSCQEGEDTVHPGEALNNCAVYMKGDQATPAGSMPDLRNEKQKVSACTRGFLAF